MGVPLLLTWLRKRFASCFLPARYGEAAGMAADNVYIDLNSLLYQSAMIVGLRRGHFVSTEEVDEAVLRKLYDLLDDILFRLVRPGALVYIAVDGVSPLGKMAQQRARRRRHGGRRVHAAASAAAMAELPAGSRADNMDVWWDSNCISVGTCFMAKVTGALHAYAVSRSERVNRKRFDDAAAAAVTTADSDRNSNSSSASTVPAVAFTPLAIVIDDVLRPGEGENKIAEVIRRFRAQPEYRRGTSHVICSSDTDVTVSSLLLHEANMHILRYEPPPEVGGRAAWQPQSPLRPPAPLGDSWLSTFFSVALFRVRLRALLGFGDAASITTTARTTQDAVSDDNFERSLHDVVFVLLLFGNDFLPTVGGSIQEGTLDALLSLLATDFVSRGRTIVTAETNDIHVPSARYLLDCLDELRSATGGSGGLQIYDGGSRNNNDKQGCSGNSTAVGADGETGSVRVWEFEQDAQFQLRRAQQERRLETKCYCYWTMLQWAMQYSAGVVDHWGCYYPYSDAPPLSALRRYCGVLSYEALIRLAAARHKERHGSDLSSTAAPPQETAEAEAVALATEVRRPAKGVDRGRPTDAMVQLLVLLPARSTALLPAVLREHYDEIAEAVQAPVELLDIDGIERWCAAQLPRLNEAERTRFTAYRVFAQHRSLAAHMDAAAVDAVCPATTTTRASCDAINKASDATREVLTQMCVGDVTFIAYWPVEVCRAELQRLLAQSTAKPRDTTDGGCTATAVTPRAGVGDVGLFFQSRPSKTVASALTELLVRPCRAATVTAPVPATPYTTPQDEESAPPERRCVSISADRLVLCGDDDEGDCSECSSYVFLVASCEALSDAALIAAMGTIDGSHFSTTMYSNVTQQERRNTLSCSSTDGRVRMQWRLAVAPDAGRDVWRTGAPPVQPKRARSPAPPPTKPTDAVEDKRAEVRRRLRALQGALGSKATPE